MKNYISVYSLNQIAYLMLLGFRPNMASDNNKLWYATFDITNDIEKAIGDWRDENLVVPIHQYLNKYRELRNEIDKKRGGRNE